MERQKAKGERQKQNAGGKPRGKRLSFLLLQFAFCLGAASCSDNHPPTTRPSTVQDRQKAALDDPFSYSPYSDRNDISGGEVDEWDKEGLKRDIDNVLNP